MVSPTTKGTIMEFTGAPRHDGVTPTRALTMGERHAFAMGAHVAGVVLTDSGYRVLVA